MAAAGDFGSRDRGGDGIKSYFLLFERLSRSGEMEMKRLIHTFETKRRGAFFSSKRSVSLIRAPLKTIRRPFLAGLLLLTKCFSKHKNRKNETKQIIESVCSRLSGGGID